MRISDWSSDVCSSDLLQGLGSGRVREGLIGDEDVIERKTVGNELLRLQPLRFNRLEKHRCADRIDKTRRDRDVARSEERRVGKECVVSVDLGGRRIIKKTKIY